MMHHVLATLVSEWVYWTSLRSTLLFLLLVLQIPGAPNSQMSFQKNTEVLHREFASLSPGDTAYPGWQARLRAHLEQVGPALCSTEHVDGCVQLLSVVSVLLVVMEQLKEAGAGRECAIGTCPTSFFAEVSCLWGGDDGNDVRHQKTSFYSSSVQHKVLLPPGLGLMPQGAGVIFSVRWCPALPTTVQSGIAACAVRYLGTYTFWA